MSRKPRAALYARVSTDMQAEKGKSIKAQVAEMHEYVEQRGWEVVAEYVEAGRSAKTRKKRPELDKMMAAVREGEIDIVVVHELSRISRSIYDTLDLFQELGEHNATFVSVKEKEFDFTDPAQKMFLTILAALNQYYLEILKLHTSKGKRERAREGLYNSSVAPYGYRNTGDRNTPFEIVPREAEAVRLAAELYSTRKYSLQEVADVLNERGYRKRNGRIITAEALRDILHNRFYTGKAIYRPGTDKEEIFEGKHEPILSEETFEAVQEAFKVRTDGARAYQKPFRVYLLSAISECDLCGRALRAQGTNAGRYYRESSGKRGYLCANNGIGAKADLVERQIGEVYRRLELPEDWKEDLEKMVSSEEEQLRLEQKRERMEAERRRLLMLYRKGYYEGAEEEFEEEFQAIKEELAALPTISPEVIEEAAEGLSRMREVWDEATMEEKRDMVRMSLERVQVDVSEPRITGFRPYPPFIPLFREMEFLHERSAGFFSVIPTSEEEAEAFLMEVWPALKVAGGEWLWHPYVRRWEVDPAKGKRITPRFSKVLKKIRRNVSASIVVAEVEQEGYPPLKLDRRKWPEVRMERLAGDGWLEKLSEMGEGSVHVVHAPFVLQGSKDPEALVEAVTKAVKENGVWMVTEPVIARSYFHWIARFFPEVWKEDVIRTLDVSEMAGLLAGHGWKVRLLRKTVYQEVEMGLVEEVLRGFGERVSGEEISEGLEKLKARARERRGKLFIPSTVVMIRGDLVKG